MKIIWGKNRKLCHVENGMLIQNKTVASFTFPHGLCPWFSYLSQDQDHLVAIGFIYTLP